VFETRRTYDPRGAAEVAILPAQTTVASLTLPAGNYEISLLIGFDNQNNGNAHTQCFVDGDEVIVDLAGVASGQLSWHKASANRGGGTVSASCRVWLPPGVHSNVMVPAFSFTAITVGPVTIQ
jgi:hypothetical protein